MSASIAGMGWITPLGADLDIVWERFMRGDVAEVKPLANPESGRVHQFIPVPSKLVDALARNPRLRRSSPISYFAVAAGLAALENAGVQMNAATAARTALVFAVTNGGVLHTRKFYEQIVKQGANCASPLLFPETVYNAPASHLAAQLGIDGASYTLVGDSSVGMSALHFAEQLLATDDIDQCLVVAAEECDWVLCEAYRGWRLARTPLAEGAAALLLRADGPLTLRTHPGVAFFRQHEAAAAMDRVLAELTDDANATLAVLSSNGTFIDRAESAAVAAHAPSARRLTPKQSFGDAPGASALIQTIIAGLAVQKQIARQAIVSVLGFNQQASGAIIERL